MKRAYLLLMIVAMLSLSGHQALTQTAAAQADPPQVTISIYHIAPGKHLDFLKWMAAREGINKSLGFPQAEWYAHVDGDSWDYVVIAPKLSDEQEEQADADARKRGLSTGFAAGLELRHFIRSHTDTISVGPITPSRLVAAAQGVSP